MLNVLNGENPASADSIGVAGGSLEGVGDPVVVIGGGPVGVRVVQELERRGQRVILFNAERWEPYNRVKLTPLLAGDVQMGQVYLAPNYKNPDLVTQFSGVSIVDIDLERREVTCRDGKVWSYSNLVICTGSRPHIPPIEGRDLDGVYTFRNFDDVEKLVARSMRSRRTLVIGGGLLGLEAARGMANRKVETWVIEHEMNLMARQLDGAGAELLKSKIEDMGLQVRTGVRVTGIEGEGRVERVNLSDGEVVECDSVIICTGIRPNMELARDVGIRVGRAIRVDSAMRTSDPNVFAAGECAEFDGNIFGLVGPGLEQASIVAAQIAGEKKSYTGSVPATKLKVIGVEVFSMGDVDQIDQRPDLERPTYVDESRGVYRRLVLRRRKLVGAIALGPCSQVNQLQQAVAEQRRIWPWQVARFVKTGEFWNQVPPSSVQNWPDTATVCNCTGVTRGQLGGAIFTGCSTVEDLKRETGASTVCGTCEPLVQELLGGNVVHKPIDWFKPVAAFSVLALVIALITLFVPVFPYTDTIKDSWKVDTLWRDGIVKQYTGFTLLGLSVFIALLSLRKRLSFLNFGAYATWRMLHVAVGALALLVLFLHTGFRLGHNLNFWLMGCFLALALVGAIAGGMKAAEHWLLSGPMKGQKSPPATIPIWVHILAFWPLPVLLAAHIFTVYYY